MPVSVSNLTGRDPRILYYDPREHPIDNEHPDAKVGYNGHIALFFQGRNLTVEYRDILNNNLLLSETFIPDGGTLQRTDTLGQGGELRSGEGT